MPQVIPDKRHSDEMLAAIVDASEGKGYYP
jgi:hypothetical protein